MAEHLNINLLIAGRPYKLKVAQDEEGYVRQAAKDINDKIADYQKTLLTRDRQDFLSMIALQATTEVLQSKNKATNANIDAKLDELEILLDKALGLTLF